MNRLSAFFKRTLNVFACILLILAVIYLAFMFSFGGYGKKPVTFHFPQKQGLHFAHRAMSLYYPESSLLAVKGAMNEGLNGVELDITKDANGELIIFHDETTRRLLGINGNINQLTLAQIKQHPLIFQEKTPTTSYVISVKELFDRYRDSLLYYFDMKLGDRKTADDMAALINKYHMADGCLVASSDILFIFYMEKEHPEINTVLEGFNTGKEWTWYLMPEDLKPDLVSGYSWYLTAQHAYWLKQKELINYRIVYGVDTANIGTIMSYGFKHLIMDYDTVMRPLLGLKHKALR